MKANGGLLNDLYVASRSALLDVVAALGEHAERVVLVGAQAIYMRTSEHDFNIAPYTKDADIALLPPIAGSPRLEEAMTSAGLSQRDGEPGIWVREGAQVDLLVPSGLADIAGRRAARLPGHSKSAARKVAGLEGAAVDFDVMPISGLRPGDVRSVQLKVAGPAALLIAKVHRLAEKPPSDALRKDAHDVFRLLVATETGDVANRMAKLLADERSAGITADGIRHMEILFGVPSGSGSMMAGAAEIGVGDPSLVAASVSALVDRLLIGLIRR